MFIIVLQSFYNRGLLKVNFFVLAKLRGRTHSLLSCCGYGTFIWWGVFTNRWAKHCHQNFYQSLPYFLTVSLSMCHHNILKSYDICSANFCPKILAKIEDSLKQDQPCRLVVESRWLLLNLLTDEVSHVLEHADCAKVVVDVVASVARKHMNGIQNGRKILLA